MGRAPDMFELLNAKARSYKLGELPNDRLLQHFLVRIFLPGSPGERKCPPQVALAAGHKGGVISGSLWANAVPSRM